MKQPISLKFEFVKSIPEELAERTLYISMDYGTVVHKCCCGCGREVVTPLSPTDWKLIYDGASISLSPSVGNWSFPCRSHYWINQGAVHWAEHWSDNRIAAGRAYDRRAKDGYFADGAANSRQTKVNLDEKAPWMSKDVGFWARLSKLWAR